jgi:GTPase SAR1 family protein
MCFTSVICLLANRTDRQWISEVLHFCSGLPIILVGCKKDLRFDPKTIEELHKTSQKPVTAEQVRLSTVICVTSSN